jgi:ABC-type phosphate/phosphonate transport system substrate-binding protein
MTDTTGRATELVATLPMYDWPRVAGATDRFYAHVRDALRAGGQDAPDALTREDSLWAQWESPGLVFGQTCGMPFRTHLHDKVALVGTPDFALPDAPPGYYYSVFVVRKGREAPVEAFIDRTLAFNGQDSQSGWAAPQNHAAARGLMPFTHTLHTGAHRLSARAVADGRADIASIDAVTWRFLERLEPELTGQLSVIAQTDPTPGLPYICATGRDLTATRAAVAEAVTTLSAADRADLGLAGFVRIPLSAYLAVPTPPPPSQDAPQAWAK